MLRDKPSFTALINEISSYLNNIQEIQSILIINLDLYEKTILFSVRNGTPVSDTGNRLAKSKKINKVAEKSNNVTETVVPSDTVVMAPAVSNVITDVRAVKNIDTDTDGDTTNAVPDGSDPADVKVVNEPTDSNSNAPDNRPSSSDSGPFLNSLPPLIDLSSLPGWKTTARAGSQRQKTPQ